MMRRLLFLLVLLNTISLAQDTLSNKVNLFSPANVKKFADYLYSQRDYLRAVNEYKRYPSVWKNDTVNFKIGIAYSNMGYCSKAAEQFLNTPLDSKFYNISRLEYLKSVFQDNDFEQYRRVYVKLNLNENFVYYRRAKSLYTFSYLFTKNKMPGRKKFLNSFNTDIDNLTRFYDWKVNPPYKSPLLAAILSAVVPGAGKFYTEKYADGAFAFLTVGILGYITYTDFHAHHEFRSWLFSALTAGFYGGNIYGSAASAEIFNAKISFDFIDSLKNYLEKVNFFVPKINL